MLPHLKTESSALAGFPVVLARFKVNQAAIPVDGYIVVAVLLKTENCPDGMRNGQQ